MPALPGGTKFQHYLYTRLHNLIFSVFSMREGFDTSIFFCFH